MPADRDLWERLADALYLEVRKRHDPPYNSHALADAVLSVLSTEYVSRQEFEAVRFALGECVDALWTVMQETEHKRFGSSDYDLTSDHLWEVAKVAYDTGRDTIAERPALREAGQYEQVGWWVRRNNGWVFRVYVDGREFDTEAVPLYRKSTGAGGEPPPQPGKPTLDLLRSTLGTDGTASKRRARPDRQRRPTRRAGRLAVAHTPTLMVAGRCPVCGEAEGEQG